MVGSITKENKMGGLGRKKPVMLAAVLAGINLSACAAYQGIEPIVMPPPNYQADTAVKVEFVHPAMVGVRCAERGVTFIGMPGLNSGACANEHLITMPNPCLAVAGGWYASVMCHELAHTNGWAHDHRGGSLFAQAPIQPARLSAQALAYEASQRAAQAAAAEAPATEAATVQTASLDAAPARPAAASWLPVKAVDRKTNGAKRVATLSAKPVRTASLPQPAWLAPAREREPLPVAVDAPIAVQHSAPPMLALAELAPALAAQAKPTAEPTMLAMLTPAAAYSGLRARQRD
jgi:hypothetical protein